MSITRIHIEVTDRRLWAVVGKYGAFEFWVADCPSRFGGVETYRRTPFDYSQDKDIPDHADCQLLSGPCWHDGTRSWAYDLWIPMLEGMGEDFDRWAFMKLEECYIDEFGILE